MKAFVYADGTRGTCVFHTVNPGTPNVSLTDTNEEQRAFGTFRAQLNGSREDPSSAEADLSTNEAPRETVGLVVATPKPAAPASGMSVPNLADQTPPASKSRLVKRATAPHRNTVPAASYQLFLIVSVVVLVLALLTLLAAAIAFVYFRWFSACAVLARAVNRGLKRNEFHLEYQPVFYTRTRKCIGLEAVLRWTNVAYGFRGEAWYMAKLADRRATRKIIAFILSTAEAELGLLTNSRNLYLMVSLWESCLGNEDCLSLISTRARSFTSSRLVFQIKAEDVPKRLRSMLRLRRDNVRVALSGVRTPAAITASMRFPGFEFIKVDRDVMGLEESDRLRTLQAISAMGRQLDVAVIADGVEGIGQNHAVERAHIDLAQGFFLCKAMSADRLPTLFERLDWWQGRHAPASSSAGLLR
jgi:EAL domain-containing protein (putative c-di-GMP-specific phosphodiesterase class I)